MKLSIPFTVLLVGSVALWAGMVRYLAASKMEGSFGPAMVTLLSAAFLLGGLLLLGLSRHSAQDLRAVEALARGDLPEDGQLAAIHGRIRPLGPLLEAPLSGKECVAFSYRIVENTSTPSFSHHGTKGSTIRDTNRRRRVRFEGHGLAPVEVSSGRGGARLAGFPNLERFRRRKKLSVERAKAVAKAVTESRTWLGSFVARHNILTDDSGQGSAQWSCGEVKHWHDVELEEWILAGDRMVCAVGRWNLTGPALTPSRGRVNTGVSLYPGDLGRIGEKLATDKRAHGRFGAVAVGIAIAVAGVPLVTGFF